MERLRGNPAQDSAGSLVPDRGRTPAGKAVIELQDFQYRHLGCSSDTLHTINLRVEDGEKILITGPSGSGKSTLLRVLAGLDDDAQWRGRRAVEGPVGLVLQDPDSQVIASRVGDDVAFGCENLRIPRQKIWDRVESALAQVGLRVPLNFPTSCLSGGQKQRLALAGVLAMGARVILLDEPTANLDASGRQEVMDAINALDKTVVIVDHRPWPVDRVLLLDHGELHEGEFPHHYPLPPARSSQGVPSLVTARNLLTGWADSVSNPWGGGGRTSGAGAPEILSETQCRSHTFSVPEQRSTVIVGPNGAGKTTLALTIAGLLPYWGGELRMAASVVPKTRAHLSGSSHHLLQTYPARWTSQELASRIGFVFQNPDHQFVARTVRAELEVGLQRVRAQTSRFSRQHRGKTSLDLSTKKRGRVDELLDRLRLRHCENANPFTLSGGEKRRLSVATALVSAPRLLLLDEPTFGQDPDTFRELVSLLRELTDDGVTVVSVTHDEDFIETLGDHRIEVAAP